MRHQTRRWIAPVLLALLVGLWPATPVVAQDLGVSIAGMTPEQVRTFLSVARQVQCPCASCVGLSLLECRMTKPQCGTSKAPLALAAQLIRAGQSEADVIDTLTRPSAPTLRSGPEVKAAPTPAPAPSADPATMKVGDSPTLRPDDAKVTVFTFSDFQWGFCKRVGPTLEQLVDEYDGKVRLAFKHYPLQFHGQARDAARIAILAQEYGKFWEVQEALFENMKSLGEETYLEIGRKHGIPEDRIRKALKDKAYEDRIDAEVKLGQSVGVTGTPATYIAGKKISGAKSYDVFKNAVDEALGIKPKTAVKRGPVTVGQAPILGPEKADVTIVLYSDFQWPYCKKVGPTFERLVEEYDGKVRVAFKHNPLPFHKKARDAARFSILAQEHGKFWEVHDALFENMKDLGLDLYLKLAAEHGIPEADVRRVIEEKAYEDRIEAEMKEMAAAGARGTPASFVNGNFVRGAKPYESFKEAVDKALARGNLGKDSYISDVPPPKPPPPPYVGEIDVGDAPLMGPKDAPVTVVLYSDFQWPFCARVGPTLKRLVDEYDGLVRVAFKQFPLPNHTEARNAARLALLAQERGKFWEVHDAIFENMRSLGTDTYVKIGAEHGIPEEEVRRVLEEKAYEKRINAEYAEGNRYQVNSTPTSFVNGNRVKGAKPYEGFKEEVDKALEKKGLKPPAPKTGALPPENEPASDPGTVKAAARPGGGHVGAGQAPVKGAADAPVTIVTFGDYQWPECAGVGPILDRLLERYEGRVRVAFKHFPGEDHRQARDAARFAILAQEYGKFQQVHGALFANRNYLGEGTYLEIAAEHGIPEAEVLKVLDGNAYEERIAAEIAEALAANAMEAPATFVNGRYVHHARGEKEYGKVVERVLARGDLGRDSYPSDRLPPRHRPAAEVGEIDLGEAPTLGPGDAPVTIVTWSDFQWPYCGRVGPTLKRLVEAYEGKVRVAFKHYPLAAHTEARDAARVAILAQERGKFWEVHDALFERLPQLGDATYAAIGRAHGIPEAEILRVLEENAYEDRIRRDVAEARRYEVKSTPTSFVNGRRVRGARDYEYFRTVVDQALAALGD